MTNPLADPEDRLLIFHLEQHGYWFALRPDDVAPAVYFQVSGYRECQGREELAATRPEVDEQLDRLQDDLADFIDAALGPAILPR